MHNGSEAMTVFPQIQYMPPEEQERSRKNLLAYCRLDTLAMVKVWEELRGRLWDESSVFQEQFLKRFLRHFFCQRKSQQNGGLLGRKRVGGYCVFA